MEFRRPLALWKVPAWPRYDDERAGPSMPIILLYHSISKAGTDPWGVRVKPRNFVEQMAVVAAHCQPMRLVDVDAALHGGSIQPRSVVITFDDGYVDNLTYAKPAMQRHNIPGTVFVSSGYVDQAHEYWWDEIDRLILQPGTLPGRVEVKVCGRDMQWDLDGEARYGALRAHGSRHWFAWDGAHGPRQQMFCEFWAALRACTSVHDREQAIDQVRQMARTTRDSRPTHRCCTSEQVRDLARGGLIEIGAHTVHHPSLGHISVPDQRQEIVESKATLEDILQSPVNSFAYPFGSSIDYSAATISLLQEAGVRQACANYRGALTADVDRFQYPRRVVMDWDGAEFARRLAGWFAEDAAAVGQTP
jgi:peptidoglycan/xylan/chitin deacetylase (PgdA/CDA1 family)